MAAKEGGKPLLELCCGDAGPVSFTRAEPGGGGPRGGGGGPTSPLPGGGGPGGSGGCDLALAKIGCIPDVTAPLDAPFAIMLDDPMRTILVLSPSIAEAAWAVRATSPSDSMDDCFCIDIDDTPLTISLRSCKIISFALSKSAVSCAHSLVFSSS